MRWSADSLVAYQQGLRFALAVVLKAQASPHGIFTAIDGILAELNASDPRNALTTEAAKAQATSPEGPWDVSRIPKR